MSALRHIKTVNASGVNGVTLDNVFTTDFDVYKITINNLLSDIANWAGVRLTQANGIIFNSSVYNYAVREYNTTTSATSRNTNQSSFVNPFYFSTTSGGGAVLYVANAARADRTVMTTEASSGSTTFIGNFTGCSVFNQDVYTGVHIYCSNAGATITDAKISVFGYKKDL